MIRFFLICIYLFAVFFSSAQTHYDSLKAKALEYERAYFENTSNYNVAISYKLMRIDCIALFGDFPKASKEAYSIKLNLLSDSMAYLVLLKRTYFSFLLKDYSLALANMEAIEAYYTSYFYTDDVFFYRILNLNAQRNWLEAKQVFNEWIHLSNYNNEYWINEVEQLYSKKQMPKIKDSEKATTLSSFIPGLGQLYVGNIGESFGAFSFNLLALSYMGVNFWLGNYITTFSFGSGLLYQFHSGNRRRASFVTERQNAIRTITFNEKTFNQCIDFWTQKKGR
jgi:hypothetical protein